MEPCGRKRQFVDDAPLGRGESIDESLAVLATTTSEVVCCRHVSHLTTTGGEVQIGDVTVVPEAEEWGRLLRRIRAEIPGARPTSAYSR
jgi:hypothetical protein